MIEVGLSTRAFSETKGILPRRSAALFNWPSTSADRRDRSELV